MSSAPNVIGFPTARARVDQLIETERSRAASEERLRIARELHDVVSHSFATIKVQAGVALHLLDDRSAALADALLAIDVASKDALGELREILGQLRGGDDSASRSTAPGVAGLEGLLATVISAGVQARLVVTGDARTLPPAVDLAAFRIVQESLANVLRHAGSTSALVTLAYKPDRVEVEVANDEGPRSQSGQGGCGYGIVGMRERVAAVGGRLEAGLRPNGGFRVRATLPLFPRR
jgi:signal transduction histidine kinase